MDCSKKQDIWVLLWLWVIVAREGLAGGVVFGNKKRDEEESTRNGWCLSYEKAAIDINFIVGETQRE